MKYQVFSHSHCKLMIQPTTKEVASSSVGLWSCFLSLTEPELLGCILVSSQLDWTYQSFSKCMLPARSSSLYYFPIVSFHAKDVYNLTRYLEWKRFLQFQRVFVNHIRTFSSQRHNIKIQYNVSGVMFCMSREDARIQLASMNPGFISWYIRVQHIPCDIFLL